MADNSFFANPGPGSGASDFFNASNAGATQGGFFSSPGSDYGSTAWGKVTGFVGSALEAFPEFFGHKPSPEVESFRAANPVSGFVSELLGTGATYGLAAKGLSLIPAATRVIEAAPAFLLGEGASVERPIASLAAKFATETALIEGGRLAARVSGVTNPIWGSENNEGIPTQIGGSLANVALGGALGAGVGAVLGRMGTGPRIFDLVPDAHPQNPLVQRTRALQEAVDAGGPRGPDGSVTAPWTEDEAQALAYQLEQTKRANLLDIEPAYTPSGHVRLSTTEGARPNYSAPGTKIVQPLQGDTQPSSGRSYTDALNVLMNPNADAGRLGKTRLLLVNSGDYTKGFETQADLNAAVDRIGLNPDDLALIGQNQRVVTVETGTGQPGAGDRTAASIENVFTGQKAGTKAGPFAQIGDAHFLAREEDNGMWVHAIKIEGEVGSSKAGDKWFLMRSDNPDLVDPQAAHFRDVTINRSAYWPARDTPNIGSDTYDLANTFEKTFGAMQLMPRRIRPSASAFAAMGKQVSDDLIAYVSPAVGVFSRNNKANYALNLAKTMTDAEEARVSNMLHGTRQLDQSASPARQFVTLKEPTGGGLADFYKTLTKEDWRDVQDMLELRVPYEDMRQLAHDGHISPAAYQTLSQLEQISRGNVGEIEKLKQAVGAPNAVALVEDFNARKGHYGLSESREGGFYQFVDDARTGQPAGMVAGNTGKEARDKAVALIAKHAKQGRDLTLGGGWDDLLRSADNTAKYRAAIRRPGFLRERGDWLGAEVGNGELNAQKFTQLVERNLKARERFKTNVVLQEKLWPTMNAVHNEDRTVWNQLVKRIGGSDPVTGEFRGGILQGDEGAFARFQNAAADRVLGPVLGRDSASRIVQNTQKFMNAFQFGFANLSHYVTNALSMFQTTFPEAAFLLRTAGRDTSNYITLPLVDRNGRIVDSVSALSDVHLFGTVMKRVFSPSGEPEWNDLLREMTAQGIVAPRYAEAHVGATGTIVRDLKGAWTDGKSFTRWLSATNEIMLAKSEEFNRVVGTATAYELAKMLHAARPDMGMMEPFRLARFTREFMSKTAFNYTTFDRPSVFTTPVGSLLGTFKTWMFHYMVNMAKYAGGGRETLAPLLWQTGATAALGGLAASPLIQPMANAASRWLTDKSFMNNVYQWAGMDPTREHIADFMMYGFPGTFGLSIAAQMASPGSDPARDASMLWSFASFDRMRAFGQFAGDAIDAYKATGQSPFADDQVRNELIRSIAPRTLYRALSVAEDHAVKSLNNGYRVLDNVSLGDSLLYTFGFNPVNLDKTYVAYNELRTKQQDMRDTTMELGRQLAEAWENNDNELATRVFTSAMAQGLDTGSVQRSAKARQARGETTQLQFAIGKDKKGAAEAQDWAFIAHANDEQ